MIAGEGEEKGKWDVPAIKQLGAHVFEVCVSHVVDAEDVDVGVEGDTFLDVGVEAEG